MATISSLGIGSGLDLSGIVEGLVEAERAPTEFRLDNKEETLSTKLSAFGALKSSLSLFQGSLDGLKNPSNFDSRTANLSDDTVFSTFVSSVADPGSYSVEVTQLAKAHSIASSADTAFEGVDDTVGTGTLTIKFGTTATGPYAFTEDTSKATEVITVSAANNNTTLSGLRDYINEGDFGFSASIVNDGTGYRLTMTSDDTGANNSMEITVTDDGDSLNNDNVGLSQLAYNALAQTSMAQTVEAKDAALTINGLNITRENNTVAGAIDGVTLNLLKADVGNQVSVTIGSDTAGVKSSIEEFVAGYNGLVETINTLTDFDTSNNSGGILLGDFTVRSMTSQLRNVLSTSISQLSSGFQSLADIGITTGDGGLLQLNSATLDDALANSPDDVASIFTRQGRSSDAGINFISSGSNTQDGNYAINISEMATQGVFNGNTLNSLVINANNDTFSLSVDGVASGTISLTQGTYSSGTELAAHIQAQINDDTSIKGTGKSVQVQYDSVNNELDINSLAYGSGSSIDFLTVDASTATDLGFSVVSGVVGKDVSGTINGASATGSGQLLTSNSGASAGIVLSVTSGTAGTRDSLTYTSGFINSLDSLLASFTGANGVISNRETGFNNELANIAEQRAELELRVTSLEERLVQQFSALDRLVARFNTTSEFLGIQLSALPEPNSASRN
jgi:flagellar hook-associated protein 2